MDLRARVADALETAALIEHVPGNQPDVRWNHAALARVVEAARRHPDETRQVAHEALGDALTVSAWERALLAYGLLNRIESLRDQTFRETDDGIVVEVDRSIIYDP